MKREHIERALGKPSFEDGRQAAWAFEKEVKGERNICLTIRHVKDSDGDMLCTLSVEQIGKPQLTEFASKRIHDTKALEDAIIHFRLRSKLQWRRIQ